MKDKKRKWLIANIINETFKIAVVLAGLSIMGFVGNVIEEKTPIITALLAIIGLCYIIRDCMDVIITLEDIITEQEHRIKRKTKRAPRQQHMAEATELKRKQA